MKKLIHTSENIMCMSDIRGNRIKVEPDVNFSIYYSSRNTSHGPRVKILFDPTRVDITMLSNLQLCGDWKFTPNKSIGKVKSKQIKLVKQFFHKYLILFLLCWDHHLRDEALVRDYLECDITLKEFISNLNFYDEYSDILDDVETIQELEDVCRKYNLTNFYGN